MGSVCGEEGFPSLYSTHVNIIATTGPTTLNPSPLLFPNDLPPSPLSGGLLATVVDPAVAAQLDPQANPVGQHPPPTVSAQLNQPCAHRAAPAVMVAAGMTMVSPFVIIEVEGITGHDVVSQLRPVRQHPPWYTAEQA